MKEVYRKERGSTYINIRHTPTGHPQAPQVHTPALDFIVLHTRARKSSFPPHPPTHIAREMTQDTPLSSLRISSLSLTLSLLLLALLPPATAFKS